MMATIVGIAGSPRKRGNSTTLLEQALRGAEGKGAQRLSTIHLDDLTFRDCQNCGGCNDTGVCVLKDGMNSVYDSLREADIWVLSSPIYFDNISGQLKLFFDRLFCLTKKKLPGKRRAAFIIAYEDKKRDDYLKNMRVYQSYLSWFADFESAEVLQAWGVAAAGDVSKKPEFLEQARELGARLAS
jgi:multimeric flavodoxin WrbA